MPNTPKDNWDKADILGKIFAGVVLAVIALVIKTGADNISTSMKRGELVRSLIADLAAEGDKNIRQDVALIALNHSLGDDQQALIVEIAEQIVRESDYDKVAGTVAYRILEQRAPAIAKQIHDRAVIVAANDSVRADLRSSADPTALKPSASPTPSPPPGSDSATQLIAKVLPNLVFVQFQREETRQTAEALRKILADNNKLNAPGVDLVQGNYKTSIRYFREEDRPLAEQVDEIVKQFLSSNNIALTTEIQDLSKSHFTSQPGQVEIWLAL